MLEALQSSDFRDALLLSSNAKYIEDQLLLQWHFYLRKRARLFVSLKEKKDVKGSNAYASNSYPVLSSNFVTRALDKSNLLVTVVCSKIRRTCA